MRKREELNGGLVDVETFVLRGDDDLAPQLARDQPTSSVIPSEYADDHVYVHDEDEDVDGGRACGLTL